MKPPIPKSKDDKSGIGQKGPKARSNPGNKRGNVPNPKPKKLNNVQSAWKKAIR